MEVLLNPLGTGIIPFPNTWEGKLEPEQSTVMGNWSCNEQKVLYGKIVFRK